jgi:hypothetical protein
MPAMQAGGLEREEVTAYIYTLAEPLTDEVRYVGKTTNPLKRLARHNRRDGRCRHCSNWIGELHRRGLKPKMEDLEVFPDSDDNDWQESEAFWISYLRFLGCRLTNLESGGRGGKSPCAETRAKISAAGLGRKMSPEFCANMSAARLGKKATPEHIAKMRAANLGKKATPETCAKLSAAKLGKNLGKKLSPETRAKISAAKLGKKLSPEHRAKLSAAQLGRRMPPEAIAKSVAAQRANHEFTRQMEKH